MKRLSLLLLSCFTFLMVSAQQNADFTVEYASNLSALDSWSDISKFQWKAIDHGVIDNGDEMKRLIDVVKNVAPKDTVGFYKQFFDARDNQYIVLRMDQAKAQRLFHVRVKSIASTTDPSLNISKTYSTRDYIYISPVRGEQQIEIKVWPFGQGEELAKTITFHGHSYGSRGARSVMLDRSRLVEGKYDLQYVKMDDETAETDTVTISDLQPGKLYTFYDYLLNPIVEAWLRFDGFKRMKIDVNKWAEDLVTHFDDGNIAVMTGRQMPFLKHKWLEAPNPSYLDTRKFAPHDTLWLNIYNNNVPVKDKSNLVMNVTLLNQDKTPKNDERVTWGQKDDRFYVVNFGEPCAIEAYMKGFAPTVTYYRGAYDPATGWLYPDEGDTNIFLTSTRMPDSGLLVSYMELTSLQYVEGKRNDYYLANIARVDLQTLPVTSIVDYDEFASRKDKQKYVNGTIYDRLAELNVTFTAKNDKMPGDRLYLRKDKSAEDNKIKVEKLEGEARKVHFPSFDYAYWDAKFSLIDYLDINNSGRPYLAIDEQEIKKLPILRNLYTDTDEMKKKAEEEAKKKIQPDKEAEKKGSDHLDAFKAFNISFKFPLAPPPLYVRTGVDIDLVKSKKISVFGAIGIGIDFDFLDNDGATNKWKEGYEGLGPGNRLGAFNKDKINLRSTDENDNIQDTSWKDFSAKFNPDADDPDMFVAKAGAQLELYTKFTFPFFFSDKDNFNLRYIDEININGKAYFNVGARLSLIDFAGWAAGKIGYGQDAVNWLQSNKIAKRVLKLFDSGIEFNFNTLVTAKAGIYSYNDGTGELSILKSHLLGTSFQARVDASLRLGLKLDAYFAGVEGGLMGAAGVYIKGSVGDRLSFDRPFNGVAWSYRAGFGLYYRAHAFMWTSRNEKMWGGLDYKPAMLIGNQTSSNPFHPDYQKYMATGKKSAPARVKQLPGDIVVKSVDMDYPIRFLSGGDSIVYKSESSSPNSRYLRVVSSGSPAVISDYKAGGSAGFHSASSNKFDMVVFEQAIRKLTDAEAAPSDAELADCVIRNGKISKIYYAMKKAGGKWYSPKPIYSNSDNTSLKPRVALDDNGNAAVIWQEGYLTRPNGLSAEEQRDIANLLIKGDLVLSRFNGTEWSKPVKLLGLSHQLKLSEYQLSVKNDEVFIAAIELLPDDVLKPVFIHVSADDRVTVSDAPMEKNSKFELRRVGNHNVVAQLVDLSESENELRIALNSYDMKGHADGQLCSSVDAGDNIISKFHLVVDQNAKSLNNLGLMWMQSMPSDDSETVKSMLKAARLVPDGNNMHVGTPLVMAEITGDTPIYDFDGYMTNEKITGCYLVGDANEGTKINRVTSYFENQFSYSILFDKSENQAISSSAQSVAQTNFIVQVNNLGTSTINHCELTVEGMEKPIPLHLVVPAGASCQERVSIPYKSGYTINTSMNVTYDDVLGLQKKQLPRFLARREKRMFARRKAMTYTDEYSDEDAIYEQNINSLYPDIPELECYALSQRVDEQGNNYFVVRVKNNCPRKMPMAYAVVLQVGDEVESSRYTLDTAKGIIFSQNEYVPKIPYDSDPEFWTGVGVFQPRNDYESEDIIMKIPNVTETKPLYMRAVVMTVDEKGHLIPITGGDKGHEFAIITVYPSNETTSVKNVYEEGDSQASLHVNVVGSQVEVDGAQPGEDVRLYLSNGMIMGRQKASADGKATFTMSRVKRGVYLLSNKNETVKFNY
ncbi:MAG: hypothetical protein J5953_16325 [Prevotella sp.]|nr:hypothetical protein [Prevotella sp.]